MKSHRKTTTYGKAPRRLIPDYHFAGSSDHSPRPASEIYLSDVERGMQRTEQAPSKNLPCPETDETIHHLNNSYQPPGTAVRSLRILRPYGSPPNLSLRKASSSPRNEVQVANCEEDKLFDVPSSDEGETMRLNPKGGLLKRKRNLISGFVKDGSGPVCDDKSLQLHVAAEASKDRFLSQESRKNGKPKRPKSNSTMRVIFQDRAHEQYSDFRAADIRPLDQATLTPQAVEKAFTDQITPKSKAVISKQVQFNSQKAISHHGGPHARVREGQSTGINLNICDERSATQHETLGSVRSTVDVMTGVQFRPRAIQQSNSKTGAMSPVNERSSIGGSMISEHPITPPKILTLSRTTTPRQIELWNMLLKDDSPTFASIPFNLPCSGKKHYDKADLQQVGSWPETEALPKSVSQLPHKRRKLVDNLHQTDAELSDSRESSVADVGSTLSLKSENSEMDLSEKDSMIRMGSSALSKPESEVIDACSTSLKDHVYVLPSQSQPAPLHPCGGLKVTYARERSFLTDDDLSQEGLFDLPKADDLVLEDGRRRRRAVGAVISRLENTEILGEDLDEVAEFQGRTMRSIHELREAGGNARVFSEMEAMLDDIDEASTVSPSLRRSKLLVLAIKFQEPSFCRLFIDHGLDHRLFAQTVVTDDLIVDALFATMIFRLLANSSSLLKLSQIKESGVMDFLIRLLDNNQDLASSTRSRRLNLSKTAQGEFKTLWDSLLKSTTWRAGRPSFLTPCLISLQCLESLVRQVRETGYIGQLLSKGDIRSIVRILQPEPLKLPPQQSRPSLVVEMHLSISILESCTISNAVHTEDTPWTGQTLNTTVGLLSRLESWLEEDVGTLRTLTLRLYLNLTNNNPELCKAFSQPDVIGLMLGIIVSHFQSLSSENDIQKQQHKPQVLLDNLILSLGSMINLAEWSDAVRPLVLSLQFMDRCFLDTLLQLFTSKQKITSEVFSEKEASFNVAFGYLSVLLSYLCVNEAVRLRVSSRLQGGTLKQLLDAVEEFLHFHREIEEDIYQREGELDIRARFIDRLQRLVDELKMEPGSSG